MNNNIIVEPGATGSDDASVEEIMREIGRLCLRYGVVIQMATHPIEKRVLIALSKLTGDTDAHGRHIAVCIAEIISVNPKTIQYSPARAGLLMNQQRKVDLH